MILFKRNSCFCPFFFLFSFFFFFYFSFLVLAKHITLGLLFFCFVIR